MLRWLRKRFAPAAAPAAAGAAQIDAWMREAYGLHRAGKVADAEDRYRRILRARPDNVDALYLLGEIANRSARYELAIDLLGRAIEAKGDVAVFHGELGVACQETRGLERAEQCFERALALDAENLAYLNCLGLVQLEAGKAEAAAHTFRALAGRRPELLAAHVNLGAALTKLGRLDEAAASSREALRLDPICAQALSNLANIAIKRNDLAEAEKLLKRALEIDPVCFEALVNMGTVLLKQRRWDEAMRILENTVHLRPGRPEVHHNIGKICWHLGRHAAAIQALRNTLRLDPERTDAYLDLGKTLMETGDMAEALEQLRTAVRLDPGLAVAHTALGFALETLGELEQAMACYERALAIDPGFVQAHVNRGLLWILTGDFARGWPEYEWRLRTEGLEAVYARFTAPRWDGTPLAGRTLRVYAEQGLGDEIMYASCLPELLAQDGHCVIECAPKLDALLRRSFPRATICSRAKEDPAAPPADVGIPAASLPLHLRRSTADFPRERAYLRAAENRVAHWRKQLATLAPGLKVGLSWRGGVPETNGVLRSITLEHLLPVLRQEGASFVSLQYGDPRGEIARLERLHGVAVHHWPAAIDDYDETAALVCALDLTITVCTALVHLGGALGQPVWVMAPRRPEARYGFKGEGMPWYASVRMFRQPAFGDWDSVIAKVAQQLSAAAMNRPHP